ncbi:acyl-CoA thioesterase II [Propioniciclava flava]|uniref:Acyl-CoA thioesterase 2 n=1 Tax=Propioniciclava flava TaxID=2072026 RepID=A0A4Q2EMU4_9ACTN|nr:acyl-CoA thioesterase II [Propioniciclava flava]
MRVDHIDQVLDLLNVTRVGPDVFVGENPDTDLQRVFGGQVMGQALNAMYSTLPQDRLAHSMKSYFVRPGSTAAPIHYAVSRTRDGGSFSSRHVVASQGGQDIFVMTASFKVAEDGFEHSTPAPADVPDPETCTPLSRVLGALSPRTAEVWEREWASLDTRYIRGVEGTDAGDPRLQIWFRAVGQMPDDPRLHQMVLAYASDLTLLAVSTLAHPEAFGSPRLQMATIDHSMWFHRPIRADRWVLYDQVSPDANNALGFSMGKLFSEDGTLGAHAVQEGLIRMADARPRNGLV